jgi:cell fate (sporulation/competence/biofilm development) regulator YmcA (YheA/YmcA/DUF963 family)
VTVWCVFRSFHQFQHEQAVPELERTLQRVEADRAAIRIDEEPIVEEYNRSKSGRVIFFLIMGSL